MKKAYIKPTILCHEFLVEKGFATSTISATASDGYTIFRTESFDKGDKGRFTRLGDNTDIWDDDGNNGGIWD